MSSSALLLALYSCRETKRCPNVLLIWDITQYFGAARHWRDSTSQLEMLHNRRTCRVLQPATCLLSCRETKRFTQPPTLPYAYAPKRCPMITLQHIALCLRYKMLPYAYTPKCCSTLTLHNVALHLRSKALHYAYALKRCPMLQNVALCSNSLPWCPMLQNDSLSSFIWRLDKLPGLPRTLPYAYAPKRFCCFRRLTFGQDCLDFNQGWQLRNPGGKTTLATMVSHQLCSQL